MINPDTLEALPGDLIMSMHQMRAWEDDRHRGTGGALINVGEQALVIQMWDVGKQVRMRIVRNNRMMIFSCARRLLAVNWRVVMRPSNDVGC